MYMYVHDPEPELEPEPYSDKMSEPGTVFKFSGSTTLLKSLVSDKFNTW